ncbi:hypothetical protein CERZMDRAFT_39669 [Cercospora zeae-maydis SCOH1-5]|uniref:Histone-lysine N-methyltransferase, H3 lysine-36 specific n=1 Tax=Cercospora zeae-maydis SCOH1-5 TaxID=717836 RepID=A0A6A6FIA9_9PEZI|nr:hypothetical protein CERZMDRAFT_39669 [Cercospora zeae-maydis SCOH1-5]
MDTISLSAATAKEVHSGLTSGSGTPASAKQQSRSPVKPQPSADSPAIKTDDEETVGGEVTLKTEPGKPPKLSRTTSHKIEKRSPRLFFDYADTTEESKSTFEVLSQCTYANKYLGTTEHALECDCAEEWDPSSRMNHACGEDSDCINRATKMECIGDCGCGTACQNRRFHNKQYADVAVFKTEKKGYGLRANTDLRANDFIFEYIGEVIGDQVFRRRLHQYDEDGIKHFYFMSLSKGEFVDATKKGNLGRFCNHSCNPNCYVDKWVVGDKLRMGIFAERKIKAGEELVFNYNVDRYGADPQPCYCDEPNCTGFIGGKTQTERATKLSSTIIEALGIDDADAWDTAVAKRPRKKKVGEDDEEYVNNIEPRGLDEEGVNKVMSSLMQCKEKWIAVKLLTRIQRATEDKVRHRVVRFHGYRVLKTALSNFAEDTNVCIQILDILDTMPRLTRNKIQDSKIEEAIAPLAESEDERVMFRAKELLEAWSKLEVAYRIPRVKRDPNAVIPDRKADRRDGERRRSRSRSRSQTPERIAAPTGPRVAPARPGFTRPPPRFRPPPPANPLPAGWFEATAANGATYYYTQNGTTTWQRPTVAANAAPPPPPPKAVTDQMLLQDLIKNIVASKQDQPAKPSATPTPVETPKKERKEEKWRKLPEEKQKKLYENALQPHILHVAGKFRKDLPKEDLKRWSKEFAKQVVDSDFRKGRVEDPNRVSDKRAKDVKKQCQAFFEKAKKKKLAADEKRAERKAQKEKDGEDGSKTPLGSPPPAEVSPVPVDDDALSNQEMDDAVDATPQDTAAALKRRRDEPSSFTDEELAAKKQRMEAVDIAPPPPPPPPPVTEMGLDSEQATPRTVDDEFVDGASKHEGLGFSIRGAARTHSPPVSRSDEPVQTATPPTTGSPDQDDTGKASKRINYGDMNTERLQQLGVLDGSNK